MASGSFTDSFYKLLDDLGGEDSTYALNLLLDSLVKWTEARDLEKFVDDFRRTHEVKEETDSEEEQEEDSESAEESEEESG